VGPWRNLKGKRGEKKKSCEGRKNVRKHMLVGFLRRPGRDGGRKGGPGKPQVLGAKERVEKKVKEKDAKGGGGGMREISLGQKS